MKRLSCGGFGLQLTSPGVGIGINVEIVDVGHDPIQTSKSSLTYNILGTHGILPQQSEFKESMN